MEIKLYHNTSANNKIDKSLHSETTYNGSLRDDSKVINPEIMIESSNLTGFNYAYIPSFHRYYYIDEITSYRSNLWIVRLKVDVLMSFASDIKGLTCVIEATEGYKGNDYLSDSDSWVSMVKAKTDIINFNGSSLLSNGEYILITAGG